MKSRPFLLRCLRLFSFPRSTSSLFPVVLELEERKNGYLQGVLNSVKGRVKNWLHSELVLHVHSLNLSDHPRLGSNAPQSPKSEKPNHSIQTKAWLHGTQDTHRWAKTPTFKYPKCPQMRRPSSHIQTWTELPQRIHLQNQQIPPSQKEDSHIHIRSPSDTQTSLPHAPENRNTQSNTQDDSYANTRDRAAEHP